MNVYLAISVFIYLSVMIISKCERIITKETDEEVTEHIEEQLEFISIVSPKLAEFLDFATEKGIVGAISGFLMCCIPFLRWGILSQAIISIWNAR